MKQRKTLCLILAFVLSLSLLVGCGNNDTVSDNSQGSSSVSEQVDENQAAAEQLLLDLKGTYEELWPVVLADEYQPYWLEVSTGIVGEENAQSAVDMMQGMVTATIYGEEAAEAYKDGGGAYDCSFLQGVAQFEFDGTAIKGYDESGNEVFSHTYHYVGMEEIRGLYEYESDDKDSGEFTYFCLAPDTSETTYHIEFRYGSNLEDLGKYDDGPYAYWLASGISVDWDEEMAKNSIELFCTENLSE